MLKRLKAVNAVALVQLLPILAVPGFTWSNLVSLVLAASKFFPSTSLRSHESSAARFNYESVTTVQLVQLQGMIGPVGS